MITMSFDFKISSKMDTSLWARHLWLFGECGVPTDLKLVFPCNIVNSYMLIIRFGVTVGKRHLVWHGRMMNAMISGLDRALVGFM